MRAQEEMMAQMEAERQDFLEKLRIQQAQNEERMLKEELIRSQIQIRNINQDPQMSGMFKYAMVPGKNMIGKKTVDFDPSVPLSGVAIATKHCILEYNQ